jgi:gas vesicle protein
MGNPGETADPPETSRSFNVKETAMITNRQADGSSAASGGAFLLGMLTGTVIGAGLGMLFAPKSGAELREQLSDQATAAAGSASEGYRRATEAASESYRRATDAASEGYRRASDAAAQWADRGKDMYDQAKDSVAQGVNEAKKYAEETA